MIIAINGKLQSGKSSSCKFITAEIMKSKGLIADYAIEEDGSILVPAFKNNEWIYGAINLESKESEFTDWARRYLWNEVKIFNFADPLKEDVCKYYGIDPKLVWGSQKDKDTKLSITWGDLKDYPLAHKEIQTQRITVRDLLIIYGYYVRSIDENAFVKACLSDIKQCNSKVSLIGDLRYPNEILKLKELNAKIIRLKRVVEDKDTPSEKEMDNVPDSEYDLVIPKEANMTEKNILIKNKLYEWGII